MISLEDGIIKEASLTKEADLKLSKEVGKWEDEILEKFQEDITYLPTEYGTEIVIDNYENSGYAEGKVVVWNKDIAINFPIIVKEYTLSPFDVFRTEGSGEDEYQPADEEKVLNALDDHSLGRPSKYYPNYQNYGDIKTPGGIPAKESIWVNSGDSQFLKSAGYIDPEKLEKFNKDINQDGIKLAFLNRSGGIIQELHSQYNRLSRKKKKTVFDMSGTITKVDVNTLTDDYDFDPGTYAPLDPGKGKVVTLQSKVYPSVQDFITKSDQALAMLTHAKKGAPVNGILLNCKYISRYGKEDPLIGEYSEDIFISLNGKIWSKGHKSYRNTAIFYGKESDIDLQAALTHVQDNTTSDHLRTNIDNRGDGSDMQQHKRVMEFDGGKSEDRRHRAVKMHKSYDIELVVVTRVKEGGYAAYRVAGPVRRAVAGGDTVYSNSKVCFVPMEGITAACKVSSVSDYEKGLLVPDNTCIIAVPTDTIFINADRINKECDPSDFVRPDFKVREVIVRQIKTAGITLDNDGFVIESDCMDGINKLAQRHPSERLNPKEAFYCLTTMGMSEKNASDALQKSIKKVACGDTSPLRIYGVSDQYLSSNPIEKVAKSKEMDSVIEEIVNTHLNFDTTKIASLLDDPESVEQVLNVNFINKENLESFIESISEFERVRNKLAKMLVSARMGLTDIDKEAAKKAMETLGTCVKNLRSLKMSLGK